MWWGGMIVGPIMMIVFLVAAVVAIAWALCQSALNIGSDSYVERPDRQGLSRTLNPRRTALSYVRPCSAGVPLAMMNSAALASLIKFSRSEAQCVRRTIQCRDFVPCGSSLDWRLCDRPAGLAGIDVLLTLLARKPAVDRCRPWSAAPI